MVFHLVINLPVLIIVCEWISWIELGIYLHSYFIRITSPKSEFEFRYFEMKSDKEADEKFSEKNAILLFNKMCKNHFHREKESSNIEGKHFHEIL